jgi:saccharopine dehydrogenase-like NADP-dependent oxidoreductase
VVGAEGVGDAVARVARERDFFELMVVADPDLGRAERTVAAVQGPRDDPRYTAAWVDPVDRAGLVDLARRHRVSHVVNASDARFAASVLDAVFEAGADYLDLALSPSRRHDERPYAEPGVVPGSHQFAKAVEWERADRLALVGMAATPGLSDVFARYAADHLFSDIDELGTLEGSNLTVDGHDFAPWFSIWTTIGDCLDPPLIWERGRGLYVTEPFSEPETFDFPEGIGPVECVNVEHGEVVLMPRWIRARRVTFKRGLGTRVLDVLRTLHLLGLDATDPVTVLSAAGPVRVSPRDVVAACLPDPADLIDQVHGKTCVGLRVTGTGRDMQPRDVFVYQVVDNAWSMRRHGVPCVTWQSAVNPVVALELLAEGSWKGSGVRGAESFDAAVFLERLKDFGVGWSVQERSPGT